MKKTTPLLALLLATSSAVAQPTLVDAIRQLNRETVWHEVARIDVQFDTYHPQGFALVDGNLFVSSVEVIEPTKRFAPPQNGLDRSAGSGKGHLFKMDMHGNLLSHVQLGEGAMYHPGGIDYDGQHIWVPVAEYRPDSRSIIYRVDPLSMQSEVVLRVDDHIGGIIHNTDSQMLQGVSWGSRRFYSWTMKGGIIDSQSDEIMVRNPSHYIDYQDCMYAGDGLAVCTGLATYYQDEAPLRVGGIEVVDLAQGRIVHQVPFPFWTEQGKPLTQNPVTFELRDSTLRMYAMPEDNQSRLFVFETEV